LILSNIQKCNTVHTGNPQSYNSDAAGGWAGWALAQPEFGRSVYPIRLRGADYAHHITASPSPLGFENPAASLYNPCDKLGNTPFKLATQFFHQQIVTLILKFIFDAEERKGTFDDFKAQLVQDLEKQDIENQENKKGINESHDRSYQIMEVMQENMKWEEKAKNEKKKDPKYGTFGLDADDRDDREINRERVRTGAAGARTRRSLGYHPLHPQNLTDQYSD
jgi:hypothetical protein